MNIQATWGLLFDAIAIVEYRQCANIYISNY